MSIDASEWVAHSTIDPAVLERWPGYRAILIASDDVDVDALTRVGESLFDEALEAAGTTHLTAVAGHIQLWHGAYRDFGIKPRVARVSVDALLRRAASDNGLPHINALVDLYNAVSMLNGVPIGGEDLDQYAGPARLSLAAGDEPFLTRAGGESVVDHPEPGEPIWSDDEGVTCRRWNWRQTTRTAIGDHTRRVGFIIDSLDDPDHRGAEHAAAQLAGYLGNAATRTLAG